VWMCTSSTSPHVGEPGIPGLVYFAFDESKEPSCWGCFTYTQESVNNLCGISSLPDTLFGFNYDSVTTNDKNVVLITITQWLTITQNPNYFSVTGVPVVDPPTPLILTAGSACLGHPSVIVSHIFEDSKSLDEQSMKGALLNSSDFQFHVTIYQQHFRLGNGTVFWDRGPKNSLVPSSGPGVLLTVEESFNNNEVLFSYRGSYIRAANFLPFVLLEFGSSRRTATSFQITFKSVSQIWLSTTDTKGNVHTWVTTAKYVYLFRGPPSHHNNGLLTVTKK